MVQPEIQNEHNFRTAVYAGLNLFLGSGFSVLAKDREGKSLPTAGPLTADLTREFGLQEADGLGLEEVATIIDHSQRQDLTEYLRRRFSVHDYDERYLIVACIPVEMIFTTNVDDLLHCVYSQSDTSYLNDVYTQGPAHADQSAVDLVALNGCVRDQERPLRFASTELAAAFHRDPVQWGTLSERLNESPTLFWGYAMRDPATLAALSLAQRKRGTGSDRWAVVLPGSEHTATARFLAALDFQIIRADTAAMLEYLIALDESRPAVEAPQLERPTEALFPEEVVPELTRVARRSIVELYRGAPPMWCDVYSPDLHRTEHFNTIRNAVNSGRNTAIIGIPASGKSTLLMQVAADIRSDAHKLFLDQLSLEKAQLILRKLNGEPALVCVDNFGDSVRAIHELSQYSHVQVVGAERDYNFEVCRHRLDLDDWTVRDVTELSDADIQACLDSIPQSIRTEATRIPRMSPATGEVTQPSLFELLEANLRGPRLKARFASVLAELERRDVALRDLLLMISYVHSCRTPVSMNMVFAFLRGVIRTHTDVYAKVERLGQMITEYSGFMADTNQDHYVPRSSTVAEAVLGACGDQAFSSAFQRFHEHMTPVNICHFHIFRRRGYGNEFALRAFPRWEEGSDFYDRVYERDRSPYLLQHKALYLAKKQRYDEACTAIDGALVRSAEEIWTIRNSHAIILFRANIGRPAEPGARGQLDRSMGILTECYESDRRKPYHACTFARQALEYWQIYGDQRARAYVKRAISWLQEETRTSPWNRQVKRLLVGLRQVDVE